MSAHQTADELLIVVRDIPDVVSVKVQERRIKPERSIVAVKNVVYEASHNGRLLVMAQIQILIFENIQQPVLIA